MGRFDRYSARPAGSRQSGFCRRFELGAGPDSKRGHHDFQSLRPSSGHVSVRENGNAEHKMTLLLAERD